jgi:hypothetical protein
VAPRPAGRRRREVQLRVVLRRAAGASSSGGARRSVIWWCSGGSWSGGAAGRRRKMWQVVARRSPACPSAAARGSAASVRSSPAAARSSPAATAMSPPVAASSLDPARPPGARPSTRSQELTRLPWSMVLLRRRPRQTGRRRDGAEGGRRGTGVVPLWARVVAGEKEARRFGGFCERGRAG